jgi:hypothetical protein
MFVITESVMKGPVVSAGDAALLEWTIYHVLRILNDRGVNQ